MIEHPYYIIPLNISHKTITCIIAAYLTSMKTALPLYAIDLKTPSIFCIQFTTPILEFSTQPPPRKIDFLVRYQIEVAPPLYAIDLKSPPLF